MKSRLAQSATSAHGGASNTFAERNREVVELPEGLETHLTMKRKRGARTDDDLIEEAMEIHAQGITLMASLRYVGLPYTTWHKWIKRDYCIRKSDINSHITVTSKRWLTNHYE